MSGVDDAVGDLLRRVVEPLVAEVRETRAELRALREALPPQLKRMDEVAMLYGYPVATQRRHIREGRLRATKIGRLVLVDVSQLRPVSTDEIADLAQRARAGR